MATTLKIEHYLIGKTIGVGASSKVKIARHELTGTNVAIKIINKRKMKNSNMSAKIKREIRLLRYFNHPNIIHLYEVLETHDDIYVVMEHVAGGELFELIERTGRFNEQIAKYYFQQIISGVEYCHLNLVAHRDLKPENILVDETNTIRIADFGLSNLMKDGKFLRTSCGSPNYAAPEIICGRKYSGVEIDTWSCGVILFALVTGYLPFAEDVLPVLFKKIREADYHMPSDVDPAIADLIRRMLQADPMKRITFGMIKKHPWLCDSSPLRLQLSLSNLRQWFTRKIDEEILQRLRKMEFNFHNFNEQRVQESILRKKDYSFVVGYELMINQKMKHQFIGKTNNVDEKQKSLPHSSILEHCSRVLETDVEFVLKNFEMVTQIQNHPECGEWQYGLVFQANPRLIMQVIIETLGQLDTTYVVKSGDYKIKCFHKLHKRTYSFDGAFRDETDMTMHYRNHNSGPVDTTFTKQEIIFNIQIYQMPNVTEHLVDIQRTKGHTLVFMDFCHSLTYFLCINMNKVLTQYKEIFQLQPTMLQLSNSTNGIYSTN